MGIPAFTAGFINTQTDESRLAELIAEEGLDDPRLRWMMRHYYAACLDVTPTVHTIAVADGVGPVLLMPMVIRDRQLSYFGMPAVPVHARRLNQTERSQAHAVACCLAVDHCSHAGRGLIIPRPSNRTQSNELANWEVKLLQAGGVQVAHYRGHVSLDAGEAGIRRQMRKSYRSLVNWGRREMHMIFVDRLNADAQLFDAFRLFHLQVAGKATRPLASWTAMFDLLKQGKAVLGLGYLEGELVAATYLFCHGGFALYGTGVYDRGQFNKPISHWPLFATMQRAGEYGARLCDLGQVFPGHSSSEKERSIAFFKKGFTDTVVDETYWQCDPVTTEV